MDKTYFDNAKAQIKEFRERMKKEGKQFFLDSAKTLFEENPELTKFGWHQYTPYYNDGDTCYFSAALDSPNILLGGDLSEKNDGEYDEDSWLNEEPYFEKGNKSKEAIIYFKVQEFLSRFDEEDVEDFFGDHCQVIVSRDGIEVEEYEHD